MKLQVTDRSGEVFAEFQAHDAQSLRRSLNPAINAIRQELGRRKLEVRIWDEPRERWTGPHLPYSNEDRWVEPLTSDRAAHWLWERLLFSLNLDSANPKAFKAAYGSDPKRH
jgi:hypothetical protein